MKKIIISALTVATAFIAFTSCSEDEINSGNESVLGIIKSQLAFTPEGGTGTIEVACDEAFDVKAEQPWCEVTVEGTTVTVTVGEYGGLENRYSNIYVTCGEESLRVTAEQFGVYAKMQRGLSYLLDDEAAEKSIPVTSNTTITIETSDDWISGDYDGENVNIHIADNDSGHLRAGCLYVRYGDQRDSIEFSQGEIRDIYGSYVASGTDLHGDPSSAEIEISACDDTTVTVRIPEYDWAFKAVFNQEDMSLSIPNRQDAGSIDYGSASWMVLVCMLDSEDLNFFISDSLSAKMSIAYDRVSGKTSMTLDDDGSSSDVTADGLIFVACRDMYAGIPVGTIRYPLVLGNISVVEK